MDTNKKINSLLRHIPRKYHKNIEEILELTLIENAQLEEDYQEIDKMSEEMFETISNMYEGIDEREKLYSTLEEDYFALDKERIELSTTLELAEKEYLLLANDYAILEEELDDTKNAYKILELAYDSLSTQHDEVIEALGKSQIGLPNLYALKKYLKEHEEKGNDIEKTHVFHIEIDNLQLINTNLTENKTNNMLIIVKEMLLSMFERLLTRDNTSKIQMFKVGSAFVIIINGIAAHKSSKIFKQIQKDSRYVNFNQGLIAAGINIEINFNIGFCPYHEHSDIKTMENLVYAAKYFAERARKIRQSSHNQIIAKTFTEQSAYENYHIDKYFNIKLHKSITNSFKGFEVHYQPQVCLATGEIYGYEALLRWRVNSDDENFANMGVLIEVAEETGAIVKIGEWLIEEVCKQIELFKVDDMFHHKKISINLSGKQLLRSELENHIIEMTTKYDISELEIGFEITESIPLNKTIISAINNIAKEYPNIAMDDFGTGCASLEHISDIKYNVIKIDKKFVDDVCVDNDNSIEIIQSIFDLAKNTQARVIVEGIEEKKDNDNKKQDLSPSIVNILNAQQCIIQGYYFSEPKSSLEILEWHKDFEKNKNKKNYEKYFDIFRISA